MVNFLQSNLFLVNFTSIFVLILSYFLFKKASGSMSFDRLNMISFIFYVFLFAMCFVGSVLIVNDIDQHYLINKLKHQESRIFGWAAVMYTMIALPLGMLMGKVLITSKSTSTIFSTYVTKKIQPLISSTDSYLRYFLYGLSALSILAVVYVITMTPDIPLLNFFRGLDSSVLLEQRLSSSRGFQGNEYFKNIFGILFTPILCMVAFGYYRMTSNKIDFGWFILMLIFTVIILSYDLQKSPIITFILGLVMVYILVRPKRENGRVIKYLFFTGVILIILYLAISGGDFQETFLSYNTGIFGRIFLSGLAGLYHSFDLFPQYHDYLEFTTLSTYVSDLFDLPYQERSARIIMQNINPKGVDAGTAGVVNSLFVGEAWSNFGMVGLAISPLYVGFAIGLFYHFILLTKKTPLFLGLYGYFSYRAGIIGGFNDYIYSAGIIVIILLTALILISARNFYLYRNKK